MEGLWAYPREGHLTFWGCQKLPGVFPAEQESVGGGLRGDRAQQEHYLEACRSPGHQVSVAGGIPKQAQGCSGRGLAGVMKVQSDG